MCLATEIIRECSFPFLLHFSFEQTPNSILAEMRAQIADLAALEYFNRHAWPLVRVNGDSCYLSHDLHACHHLAEDDVLAVEMWAGTECYEELGSVGVGSAVCHGQEPGVRVFAREILIRERPSVAVDGGAAAPIAFREISALDAEPRRDAVEFRILVIQPTR